MGVWEFLKLLVATRDNPLVKYGAGRTGGYVYLTVTLFYLVIAGGVWFLQAFGMYRDLWFLFFGATGISAVWVGVCLAMFVPRFHGRDNLEELWLSRLSQKEVLIGLLRRPFMICLYSMVVPYVLYCLCVFDKKGQFDEFLTVVLIFPLASALIGWAVFSRRWLLRSQGVVRYFLLGTLESGLYVFFAFVVSLCMMFVVYLFTDWDSGDRERSCYLVLWMVPLLFAWLKPLQMLRDAPERLFRHIDEEAYLKKNWFAREKKAWSDVVYRKRAVRRQKRFFRVSLKSAIAPMFIFSLCLFALLLIGYLINPSVADFLGNYQWVDQQKMDEMIESFSVCGPLQALFGFSGYMGLSFLVPLLIAKTMMGVKKRKRSVVYPGTLPAVLVRLLIQLMLFLAGWTVSGYILQNHYLPDLSFLRRNSEWVPFMMIQFLLSLPISCGVFLLILTDKKGNRWSWAIFILALAFSCVPLFYIQVSYHQGLYFYRVYHDVDALMFILYITVSVFLYAFGFDWLGLRYYRSRGLVD